jgi:branched-chain amino acid transport system permease protein
VEARLETPGIRMVVYSLTLILLMLFRPQGIFGQRELSLRIFRRLWPGAHKGDT